MVKILNKNNQNLYKCEECGFDYKDKEWAEKCEDWCREHHTCNIEIIKQSEENKKNMKGFVSNIEKDTLENDNFRKVLYTGKHSQLVLMSLASKEEIGMEAHEDNDQFFRFEKGQGKVIIDGNEYEVSDGFAVVVPAGAQHNVINVSESEDLKLYTIYSPAHHKDGIVRKTKEEAESDSPEFDGTITE